MSTIERISITIHQLPLDPPYPAAWDRRPRERFPIAVYRVLDSDGVEGVFAGDAMRGLDDYLGLFLGQDPTDLDRHAEVLANIDFFDGRPWPLELALWDLVGTRRGEPVWRMLGGRADRIRPYASSGSLWPLEEVEARIGLLVEAGFGAVKLRLGRERFADDVAVLARAREVGGDDLDLMVDCNQGWRMPWDTHESWTLDHATEVARALEPIGIRWLEEPLHRDDLDGMAELRQRTGIPIAGGEMTRHRPTLDALLERRCLDVFQPDAAVTAGLTWLAGFGRRVEEAGLLFSPHTWGAGTVLIANAHLAAGTVAAPILELPYDPPLWDVDRRDFMLAEPVRPAADGLLRLGEEPGFGIVLDEERLAATEATSATYA